MDSEYRFRQQHLWRSVCKEHLSWRNSHCYEAEQWISTDPALGEYIQKAPIDEEAKKYNQNLPGMGGVFNHINSNLYHYAGNNPVKYTDPDGRYSVDGTSALQEIEEVSQQIPEPVKVSFLAKCIQAVPAIFIGLFIFCLQGDSVQSQLPPGFSRCNGNIVGSNGAIFATTEQAWRFADGDPNWADIAGWGKGSFEDSNSSLLEHFKKHGAEVGANSPEQYLRKAEGFKQNLRGATKSSVEGETQNVTRYKKNGKYIDLDENKNIISFGSVDHCDEY